jgi:hypothetical protein
MFVGMINCFMSLSSAHNTEFRFSADFIACLQAPEASRETDIAIARGSF